MSGRIRLQPQQTHRVETVNAYYATRREYASPQRSSDPFRRKAA